MKKLNFLSILLSALLVSSSMWGAVPVPMPKDEVPVAPNEMYQGQVISNAKLETPSRKAKKAIQSPVRKLTSAEGDVAQIGSKTYPTLDSAFSVAQSGDVVYMINNTTEGALAVPDGVTLDMQGHYIYGPYDWYVVYIPGTSTIKNGWIYTYNWYYLDGNNAQSGNAYGMYVSGEATLEGVKILAATGNELAYYGIYINTGATLNMVGGEVYGYYGIYSYGSTHLSGDAYVNAYWYGLANMTTGLTATITDNVEIVGGASYYGIYDVKNGGGTLTISGNAKISGKYGMYTKANITISGNPTIVGDNAPAWYANGGLITINGGTFEAYHANPIVNVGNTSVYGGTFKYTTKASDDSDVKAILNYATLTLYGGTFLNKAVNNLATGYDYDDNGDGTFTVRKIIAKIAGSDVNYFTLQKAINAASDFDEINLVADVAENVTISGKQITFNANGKTLTGNITTTASADVTIQSTGTIDGSLINNGGNIRVYAGKFTQDPSAFSPEEEGCVVSGPEQGIYIVTQEVAQIGSVKYTSIASAIAAANGMSNPTVTLLADARLNGFSINVNANMTIDLQGHSLMSISSIDSYLRFAAVGNVVTIKNGTIKNASSSTTHPVAPIGQYAANTVRLENVEIINSERAAVMILGNGGSTLVIDKDSKLTGASYSVYLENNGIVENSAKNVVVGVGKTASATLDNKADASMTLVTNGVNSQAINISNKGSFEITSGIFAGSINVTSGDAIVISDGIFYDAVKNQVVSFRTPSKEWNKIRYNDDLAWDLHANNEVVVATVDSLKYFDITDALLAIKANGTNKVIKIENDLEIAILRNVQYNIPNYKNVTFDLNGKLVNVINNRAADAIFINVESYAQLTIEDNTEAKNGKITYENKNVSAGLTYTINCNGELTVNSGTIENTTPIGVGVVGYTIELGKGGELTVNGGLINNTQSITVRYWADTQTNTVMTVNGGEIKGPRAVWIQLAGSSPSSHPYAEFNMTGGKLSSLDPEAEVFYVYTYGESLDNIVINVSNGAIYGRFFIGGGSANGGNYNEDIDMAGGTFYTSNAYKSFKRGVEHKSVSGGAYYFGAGTTQNDYIKFCEYITEGHFAVKMCRDDINGLYTNDKIEGKYFVCEGSDCGDGTFWVIIDGDGTVVKPKDGGGLKEWNDDANSGAFNEGEVPTILTDVQVNAGDTIEVMSKDTATANRLVLNYGAGIIVHDAAVLDIGKNGIEVNGQGDGTTFIKVEAGGTLIANGTVVSQNVDEIIVENGGTILLDPNVDHNNEPKGTIYMKTSCRYIPAHGEFKDEYIFHHFGIPTKEAPEISWDRNCAAQFWQWDYGTDKWEQVKYKNYEIKTPFRGYNVRTNYKGTDGVTFKFEGNTHGNKNASFDLLPGFNFYANSYLAPISADSLLADMEKVGGSEMEWTIWMYDGESHSYKTTNQMTAEFEEIPWEIPSMRGFFLRLAFGDGAESGINYNHCVWMNAIDKMNPTTAAPKRRSTGNMNLVQITLSDNNGNSDCMYLAEGSKFEATFDNGYDATKLMNTDGINLYAPTMNGDLSIVATDELDGQYLALETDDQNQYTMTFTKQKGNLYQLIDLDNGEYLTMEEGVSYTFLAPKNATLSNRFQIRKITSVATKSDVVERQKANNQVYTVLGQYVGKVNDWAILPNGVYVINGEKFVK